MSKSALSLLALVVAAFARTAPAGEFVAVLVNGDRASPVVLEAMERAAESALAPGTLLTWRTSQDLEGNAVSAEMAIIRLQGQCRPRGGLQSWDSPSIADGRPLGQTHISSGRVLAIADVLCDTVWTLIGPDLRGVAGSQRDALLGRALGRVVAHELYHIMLRTTVHSQEGLFRPKLRSADLLAAQNSSGPDVRELETSQNVLQPLDSGR
jgi:hypothetical protein